MPEIFVERLTIEAQKTFSSHPETAAYLKDVAVPGDVMFGWECAHGHHHIISLHAVQEQLVLESETANVLAGLGAFPLFVGSGGEMPQFDQ